MKKALTVLVTVILALCLFVSCEEGSSTPAEYTLTFKTSGSQYEKTVSGGAYTLPNATSVTRGLSPVFRGWQIDGETEIREAGDIITVSSDMTLTARYKDDCKVTVKDGESVVAEDYLIYGERYTLPSALEKKGYNFLGWKVGEETLAAGEKITVTAATTVTAAWIKSYTCLVDYNYKEYREVYAVDKGTQVRISDWDITELAKSYNMTFVGWYLNGVKYLKHGDNWSTPITIDKNSVMTAIWEKDTSGADAEYFEVTFEDYYGTDSDLKVMILKGNTVYLPDEMNPEVAGKTFIGWYNGETKFDFSTKITADTELKAKFDPKVTVTFYSDNGTPWGVTSQSVTQTYGSTIKEEELAKSKPGKDGCEFAGWYNGDDKFEFGKTTVTANVTYTAKWNCRVTFDSNGSSDTYADKLVFTGFTVTEPATNPTTTELYKTFAYWSLSKDGTTAYDFSTPLTKSITLYAVWRDYKVGDTGPAGGYIIYAKNSASDGWRYLESARNDLNGEYKFGWYGIPSGTDSEEIGAGKSNTEKLITGDGDAAKAAKNCREGGYADWFLPSYKELKLMYKYRNEIGNFSATRYWSSTGYDNGSRYAFCIEFVNRSYTDEKFRSGTWSVRPVRQF